ncbi:ATP-binding protein [Proteiniborus sp. MB09-C3]|uniref:ATP-binding protein n=1 Tax=Proteiniborus sp. MB09-C3 TaxID=3050072 RepID=UPI00255703C9|nr:ATP-binding protein [Proteiniborus sp. MB09-C3]WIV12610.1 ATP-binding protein [Proteiniborus sp. MB09-C3]
MEMVDNFESSFDSIKLNVPNKAEYVSVVRLTTSAIASRMGFDIEEIEDIKVAIAEACTSTLEHSLSSEKENFDINFDMYVDKLVITVKDIGKGFNVDDIKELKVEELGEGGLGIFIINSLMDEVEIINDREKGTEIRMIKYIKDDII